MEFKVWLNWMKKKKDLFFFSFHVIHWKDFPFLLIKINCYLPSGISLSHLPKSHTLVGEVFIIWQKLVNFGEFWLVTLSCCCLVNGEKVVKSHTHPPCVFQKDFSEVCIKKKIPCEGLDGRDLNVCQNNLSWCLVSQLVLKSNRSCWNMDQAANSENILQCSKYDFSPQQVLGWYLCFSRWEPVIQLPLYRPVVATAVVLLAGRLCGLAHARFPPGACKQWQRDVT